MIRFNHTHVKINSLKMSKGLSQIILNLNTKAHKKGNWKPWKKCPGHYQIMKEIQRKKEGKK